MHKNYSIIKKTSKGLLPKDAAIEVADYFAAGKSEADVAGVLRVDGEKISIGVIKQVYKQIKMVEQACVNILNGNSVVYQDRYEISEEAENIGDPNTALFEAFPVAPNVPTTVGVYRTLVLGVIGLNLVNEASVYDCTLSELVEQITYVINNVICWSNGEGTATFANYKTYIQA